MTTGTKRMETILDLALGKPQAAANLVMVPLSGNPAAALSYILVDKALAVTNLSCSLPLRKIQS